MVSLLCRWVEYRTKIIKGPFIPLCSSRYLLKKRYNKNGIAIYNTEVLEGLDWSRPTAPKPFTKIHEFTYVFYGLSFEHQLVILSYIDPMDELFSHKEWSSYLKSFNIRNGEERLAEAMTQLQKESEKRGLVKPMDGELRGWDSIAEFLKCTRPTAIKLAKEHQLPVSKFGGSIYTTKTRLQEFMEKRIDLEPYWKISEKRKAKPKKRKR